MGESTWAPTPAAPTMATLQKWICGYVGLPDDTEALESALAGVHLAIDRINARNWNWAVVYEDLVMDATVIDYPVPANFKKPLRLTLLDSDGNSQFRMPFVAWQSFLDEYQRQDASGSPCVYTVANVKEYGTVSFDVMPTADFVSKYPTARIWYYRKVQRENQDGFPDWPSEFTPFVTAVAEAFVADRYAQGKAQSAYARAEHLWNNLVRDDNETQTDWE